MVKSAAPTAAKASWHRAQRKAKKRDTEQKQVTDAARSESIAYLNKFISDRSNWKFQKARQSWLCRHWVDDELVSKAEFTLFCRYAISIQGAARETLKKHAEETRNAYKEAKKKRESGEEEAEAKKKKLTFEEALENAAEKREAEWAKSKVAGKRAKKLLSLLESGAEESPASS